MEGFSAESYSSSWLRSFPLRFSRGTTTDSKRRVCWSGTHFGFYFPLYILLLLLIGIGLTWLYAAARPRLGAGPVTALKVGLLVGLIAGVPANVAQYAWTHVGGYVATWWAIETVVGCVLACLAGAWIYREG